MGRGGVIGRRIPHWHQEALSDSRSWLASSPAVPGTGGENSLPDGLISTQDKAADGGWQVKEVAVGQIPALLCHRDAVLVHAGVECPDLIALAGPGASLLVSVNPCTSGGTEGLAAASAPSGSLPGIARPPAAPSRAARVRTRKPRWNARNLQLTVNGKVFQLLPHGINQIPLLTAFQRAGWPGEGIRSPFLNDGTIHKKLWHYRFKNRMHCHFYGMHPHRTPTFHAFAHHAKKIHHKTLILLRAFQCRETTQQTLDKRVTSNNVLATRTVELTG